MLEKLQIDTKRLDDIVELYPAYWRYKLPRYEFTARDIRTGGSWISYACEGSLTNAVIFLNLLGGHLLSCGVDLKCVCLKVKRHQEKGSYSLAEQADRQWWRVCGAGGGGLGWAFSYSSRG